MLPDDGMNASSPLDCWMDLPLFYIAHVRQSSAFPGVRTVSPVNDVAALSALSDRHRLALIRALEFVSARYEPIGIIASGTIVRGRSHQHSDFDLVVAHTDTWRQRHQRWENGIPIEIFVNPVAELRRAMASDVRSGRPVMIDMLATGVIVVDHEACMRELQHEARRLLAAGPAVEEEEITRRRYTIVTEYEDAVNIRDEDPERAGAMATSSLLAALRLCFLQRGLWLPREKELLQALARLDPALERASRHALRAENAERIDLVEPLIIQVVGSSRFFAWESEREEREV